MRPLIFFGTEWAGLLAGVACFAAASAAPASDFFDGVDEASKPVMEAARQRIESIRKGDFAVAVTDEQGRPVSGQARVRLVRHAFSFGACMLGIQRLPPENPARQAALDVIDELFNKVTVCNYWKQAQKELGGETDWTVSDNDLRWAQEHGKTPRLHAIIYAFPQWFRTITAEQEWWEVFEARIRAVAQHYGKTIHEYDVINEMVSAEFWAEVRKEVESYQRFPLLWKPENGARIMRLARQWLPDATLVVLEANISTLNSPHFQKVVSYDRKLAEQGAPFDYCGYQAHFYAAGQPFQQGHPEAGPGAFTMKKLGEGLDLLASVGKPVAITEFSPPSRSNKSKNPNQPRLSDEEVAAWTVNYYTLAFSHPSVQGITRWFVIDNLGGRGMDAGLVTELGEKKPAYYALKKLLTETWSTAWQGALADGQASFRGFYGAYEVAVDGYEPARFDCAPDAHEAAVALRGIQKP
ncbi:MAG: endo-1,4-beta-xylanase [Candidatus Sumerlaeota bacterium]|nr:endo-1,4-beta-xylanase [Candidatus Sumerlaeota bacterium]